MTIRRARSRPFFEALEPRLLLDGAVGPIGSAGSPIVEFRGSAFYFANDGAHGAELYGVLAGNNTPSLIKDINPGPGSSYGYLLTSTSRGLLFLADSGAGTLDLWYSNGTTAGTGKIKTLNASAGASADTLRYVQMPNINGIYYFDTIDAGGHIDLYRTDTTAAGTQLLETLTTVDPAAATLAPVQVAGKQIVVGLQITGATPADNRALLWTSHGQTGDARPVTLPVTLQSYAALTSINGTPYFYANNTTIYRINADASATAVVIANDSPSKQVLFGMTYLNGRLIFIGTMSGPGTACVLSLTLATGQVVRLPNVVNSIGDTATLGLRTVGNLAYFFQFSLQTTFVGGLMVTNGTIAGTRILPDLWLKQPNQDLDDAANYASAIVPIANGFLYQTFNSVGTFIHFASPAGVATVGYIDSGGRYPAETYRSLTLVGRSLFVIGAHGDDTHAFLYILPMPFDDLHTPTGHLDIASPEILSGWTADLDSPGRSLIVSIRIDGLPWRTLIADQVRSDLSPAIGALHGFTFELPALAAGDHTVTVVALDAQSAAATTIGQYSFTLQNSFFVEWYYLQQNPDVAAAVRSGAIPSARWHYDHYGLAEGRSPTPLFDESYYLAHNPDVQAAVNAHEFASGWIHFLLFGQFENRQPSAYFDPAFFSSQPGVGVANPIGSSFAAFALAAQYLIDGSAVSDLPGSVLFNPQFYLAQNPDVAQAIRNGVFNSPLDHFLHYGRLEDRQAAATPTVI